MLRIILHISKLINNCSKHRIHHLAAAFSYYFILSIPPVLMLIFILSNKFLSSSSTLEYISPFIIKLFGPNIYSSLLKLLNAVAVNQSKTFYTAISIIILIVTSSSLFVFTKVSYSNYKNLNKKQPFFLDWIKTRILSISITLIILAFYFISIFLSPIIKKISAYLFITPSLNIQNFFINYIFSPFIFSFFFSVYIQMIFEKIPVKFSFISGLITSYLGKLANILLFKLIPSTLAGSIFSKAGSSLIILLYIYYIGIIIFIGFENAATLWESYKFHKSYKWLTKEHLNRLYRIKKINIKSKLNSGN
ncbi:MAG: YhjD/YihY/BrkB family envelope integrity protein [Spirochaetota bacterium]